MSTIAPVRSEEVIRDLRNLEGELEVWQTMTNDRQQVRMNLMTCMEILRRLKLYWSDAEGEASACWRTACSKGSSMT